MRIIDKTCCCALLATLLTLLFPVKSGAQSLLKKIGDATQLVVDGEPMLILGGELSNSAATSTADIDAFMPEIKALGLNTVLVPAQWDLIEPDEGEFDFTLIHETIVKARENGLKVVFLWFGAWKNSMSCYAPLWFKQDYKRFPRTVTAKGKPLEIASPFSEAVFEADNRAFAELMKFIASVDYDNTVIMMQIENEIGMLESARDHSPLADEAFAAPVPDELVTYLKSNRRELHPQMLKKLTGSENWSRESDRILTSKLKPGVGWEELFGKDVYTDEIFMAYHYARYVERLARTALGIKEMPLYVNAAMNSRGREPGQYPSAGPLAHLIDLWHCGAPSVDLLAPDIYDTGFKDWAARYSLPNNPLFIPEAQCCLNSGVRALYVFGEHDSIGYCPFSIDTADEASRGSVSGAYSIIRQMAPLILKNHGKGVTHGVLLDSEDVESVIVDGEIVLTCRHFFTLPWDSRATDGSVWPEGGAIIMKTGEYEYLIAGNGVVVTFQSATEVEQSGRAVLGEDGFVKDGSAGQKHNEAGTFKGGRIGIGYIDQVEIDGEGNISYVRRDNGDQSHQGRHARISVGENKILRVKLYSFN